MLLKKNRVVTIIKLSRKAFGKYKKQILILTILGFAGGLLEGLGVNALIPLFSFALGDGQGSADMISQTIERFFGVTQVSFNIVYLLLFIIILFILRSLVKVYLDYIKIKITADYEEEARNFVFSKILGADWPHLIQQKLGHLGTIILVDIPAAAMVLGGISTTIMLVTSLMVYIIIAINIDFFVTILTLVLGLVIFLIIKPLNYKTKALSYQATGQNKDVAHHVNENILGVKTVKSMWASDGVLEKGKVIFEKLKIVRIKIYVIRSIISSFTQPIGVIFICLIFVFTYKSPDFNLASLIAIVYLIQKIFTYIQQLQQNLNIMHEKLPYLKATLDYQEAAIINTEKDPGKEIFSFEKELKFNNLSFQYDNGKDQRVVFEDINFKVKKGEMVGIIGPSGVGKTTLVDLVLRLLQPQQGNITLDDLDISNISLKAWRENIGYISQDIFLMNDTVANNIRFYDQSISDTKIIEVAKMANIYEFVEELPGKFETKIGERGIQLSAGQRQRIVIARILARDPKILILDEATSALDNESEIKIQTVIESLKGRVAVLAIAHRLSTVEDSDKLIVLEDGRISEQGTPQELLKDKQSYFSKTYNLRK